MREKEYLINVHPIGWKRAGLKHKRFYDQQTHDKLAIGLYLQQQHAGEPKFTKPVHMDFEFYMGSPKVVKSGKNLPTPWFGTVPDLDNLVKFSMDTVNDTGVIWSDDRIVVSLTAKKVYDNNPRIRMVIKELV